MHNIPIIPKKKSQREWSSGLKVVGLLRSGSMHTSCLASHSFSRQLTLGTSLSVIGQNPIIDRIGDRELMISLFCCMVLGNDRGLLEQ